MPVRSSPAAVGDAAGGATIKLGDDTTGLIAAGAKARIAVLPFEASGVGEGIGDAVTELVTGDLSNSPALVIVERARIDAILKEMQIQRSGLTTADAVRIGQGLNATKVLLCSVRRFGTDTYIVLVRAVDVATQRIEGSRDVTCERCQESDLPAAVEALQKVLVR